MFDPERDEEPSSRRFYLRLLAVVVISAAGCIALWPSVSGFSAGPDHDTGCLAITDGWHAEKSGPDLNGIAFPAPPSPADQADPVAMARWRAEWQASQQRPEVQQAIAYLDWKDGPARASREPAPAHGLGYRTRGARGAGRRHRARGPGAKRPCAETQGRSGTRKRLDGFEQLAGADVGGRVPQLRHRPGLDLADALPGETEVLGHFLERALAATVEPEAQA